MKVNLFDDNFPTSPCSTAFQVSKYIEYARKFMSFDGATIFTDEWINNMAVSEVKSRYKIGWLHEPYCLHPQTYERAWGNRHLFDFILTYHQPFIDADPAKFRFAPYAGTWIDRTNWGIKPKSKLCSMLVGSKMSTAGHIIRHEAAVMAAAAELPVDFYGTMGQAVDYGQATKYKVLADYNFSIIAETCREDNLFTEWLLDCFALGTIPIFWGAPNIGKFFDAGGILQWDTTDRLYKILAGLNAAQWTKQIDRIYLNLLKMRDYAVTEDWIYQNVLKGLG